MASSIEIILILACACLAECRLRGKFNKENISTNEHKIQEVNTNTVTEHPVVPIIRTNEDVQTKSSIDKDMIIFPNDQDTKVYFDVNKIIRETFNKIGINNRNKAASTTYVPLLPKVVPALEAKEAFTNPIVLKDEEVTHKTKDNKENIQTNPKPIEELAEAKVAVDAVIEENLNITLDNNATATIGNDTSSSNDTVPDFTNRFGVTGNYIIVPENKIQYQAVPNVPVQGNVQQYGTNNGQGNIITPLNTNGGIAGPAQFTPNTNINNPNSQYIVQNSNALQNPYVPNANANYNGIPQGTVPISIGNTYTINGQLYAAVTVPSHANVPNSVYLINSQQQGTGYQVNNLPLYQLVSAGNGDQGNVNQYVPINGNGNNQHVPINENGNNQYVPINGNGNNQYIPINGHRNDQHVPINENGNNQYIPIHGNENNQHVPINENGNNQYVPINGNGNSQYKPINGNGNNQHVPINENGNNQYVPINGNGNNQYVPINGNGNNQFKPINGNGNNQHVPINENGNNQYVPINGNGNNQYVPINGNGNNQYPIK